MHIPLFKQNIQDTKFKVGFMTEKTKPRIYTETDFTIESVMQAGRQQGIDLAPIREKAGKNWRQLTPLLGRAHAADVLTGGTTLKELSMLMSALLDRPGDFNGWLLQMNRIASEGDPADFADRIHKLHTTAVEESVRANLGLPKKIGGQPNVK
jgi:hypothetical protein